MVYQGLATTRYLSDSVNIYRIKHDRAAFGFAWIATFFIELMVLWGYRYFNAICLVVSLRFLRIRHWRSKV